MCVCVYTYIYTLYVYDSVIYIYIYIFHEKMGTIKNRNVMELTEAEDIKKRWQQYTEEL